MFAERFNGWMNQKREGRPGSSPGGFALLAARTYASYFDLCEFQFPQL